MAGNSIGQHFRVTTFGESHGPALGCIVDGMPPGFSLDERDLQQELDRRRPGQSQYTSSRQEGDKIHILSGVFEGVTTGTSIGLLVKNHDQRPQDYQNLQTLFRPGHADYSYMKKYGVRDPRGGGRASARETVMRVAAGAIAKKYLWQQYATRIRACLTQIGNIHCELHDWDLVEKNAFFCPDATQLAAIAALLTELKTAQDSIGARLTLLAENVPAGLGEPVFDKLDADLAHAVMGINAVKGVEIGDGFSVVEQRGSIHRDAITPQGFCTNHAGGILGGISTGQSIVLQVALKPTSSIGIPINTIDYQGKVTELTVTGRHDPCVAIRAVPIVEAMVAIVLMDHLLRHNAQCNSQKTFVRDT